MQQHWRGLAGEEGVRLGRLDVEERERPHVEGAQPPSGQPACLPSHPCPHRIFRRLKRSAGRIPSGEDKLMANAITVRCLQTIDGQLRDEPDQEDLYAIVGRSY